MPWQPRVSWCLRNRKRRKDSLNLISSCSGLRAQMELTPMKSVSNRTTISLTTSRTTSQFPMCTWSRDFPEMEICTKASSARMRYMTTLSTCIWPTRWKRASFSSPRLTTKEAMTRNEWRSSRNTSCLKMMWWSRLLERRVNLGRYLVGKVLKSWWRELTLGTHAFTTTEESLSRNNLIVKKPSPVICLVTCSTTTAD